MKNGRFKRFIVSVGLVVILTFGVSLPVYAAIVCVGGGTWSYGTTYSQGRTVYSDYHHPKLYHSSTAWGDYISDKKYANAGYYSYAKTYEKTAIYTAQVFWCTY